ncbi:MAG: hypothetical protein SXA11_18420 [Cyanobacteriota bacterium]|nr:hypothetical protein [Cyanobacteriota bacterium]
MLIFIIDNIFQIVKSFSKIHLYLRQHQALEARGRGTDPGR